MEMMTTQIERVEWWNTMECLRGDSLTQHLNPCLKWEDINSYADVEQTETEQVPLSCSYPLSGGGLQLAQISSVEQQHFPELMFALCYTGDGKEQILTVTQREVYKHPPFGFTSRVHLAITGKEYTLKVLGNHLQSGMLQSEADMHELCRMISNQSPYTFCPGIDCEHYESHYHNVI